MQTLVDILSALGNVASVVAACIAYAMWHDSPSFKKLRIRFKALIRIASCSHFKKV
jgi:hypothetical protein